MDRLAGAGVSESVARWRRRTAVFVTQALRHETLGLEHIADDLWSVFFGDVLLGTFNEAGDVFTPGMGT